jgi:hypothetical protein
MTYDEIIKAARDDLEAIIRNSQGLRVAVYLCPTPEGWSRPNVIVVRLASDPQPPLSTAISPRYNNASPFRDWRDVPFSALGHVLYAALCNEKLVPEAA